MSNDNRNIIELVKELQTTLDTLLWVDAESKSKVERITKPLSIALLGLEDLKQYVILLCGSEKGRENDIRHLKDMIRIALDGWMFENKALHDKLKIAVEALEAIDEDTAWIKCETVAKDALYRIRSQPLQ